MPSRSKTNSPFSCRQEQLESSHKELTQKLTKLIEEIEEVQKRGKGFNEVATQNNEEKISPTG